ncbi:hypothetical protein [Roseateles sp. P5_E7]
MRFFVLLAALAMASAPATAVELTVVTTKGYVRFEVPDEWTVLKAQTKPPVSALAFQIANPADEGTPHSTNVAVSLMDTKTEAGKKAASRIGVQYGSASPVVSQEGAWTLYSQGADQGGVRYQVVDAARDIADVVVSIRFAWPELPANGAGYNEAMRAALRGVQNSVSGGLGIPPPRPGEVIRRPAQ